VICEEIFEDRFVSTEVARIIRTSIPADRDALKMAIAFHKAEVDVYLGTMPSYFGDRLDLWLRS
jgi:hypothetical protein